jgi:hypothetical protein
MAAGQAERVRPQEAIRLAYVCGKCGGQFIRTLPKPVQKIA